MSAPVPVSPITLRIRNVLGIAKADITIAGVTLVAGINAAGKSSLLDACAVAALNETAIRGLKHKADQAKAVRDGAEAGSITLEYPNGKNKVIYPEAEFEQTGRPAFLGSSLGIGRQRWMFLKPEDRAREFSARFNAAPTVADVKEWLAAHPGSGLELPSEAEALGKFWDDIIEQGWDASAKKFAKFGTTFKGRWEQVTKTKWGSAKAVGWTAAGIERDDDFDLDVERAALAAMKTAVEAKIAENAIAGVDRERLRTDIALGHAAETAMNSATEELAFISKRMEEKRNSRSNLNVPNDDGKGGSHPCPSCNAPLNIQKDPKGYLFLVKAPPAPDSAKLKELRGKAAQIDGDLAALTNEQGKQADAQVKARATMSIGETAAKRLADAGADRDVDMVGLAELRAKATAQERRIDGIVATEEASDIYQSWLSNAVLVAALEGDGVRQSVLDRHLGRVNVTLGEISTTAGCAAVSMGADMDLRYAERPYVLLSESERWRVDFVVAVAINQREGAAFLLLDRFDVIVAQDRGAIIMALKKLKVPALVAMTAKDRATVPDVAKAKVGAALWIEGGVVGAAH